MKNTLKKISFDIYMVGLLILTFFSYKGDLSNYFLVIIAVIGVFCIITKKDVFYVIPVPFFVQMSISNLRDNVEITTVFTVILVLLIVFDIIRNRTITKKGYLTAPLLILVIMSIVTHLNSPDTFTTFAGFMQIISVLGLYFYFVNTLEPGEDDFTKVAKIFMYFGALVTLEMMYFIYESGDLAINVIRSRSIDLGWENLNIIIYANIVSIPMIGYLISHTKVKLPYMIFALINVLGILLTLSRSSLLTIAVFVVILVPVMLKLEKQKMQLIIQGLLFIMVVSIGVYYAEKFELISDYIDAISSRNLTYVDDRIALLKVAWEQFKMHPILGSGGLYSSRVHLSELGPLNYHNTIAQASTLGIIGMAGFIWLFFRKTKMMLHSESTFKWFAIILIYVTAFVNGMLQPMYFYTTYMIFIFLILAVIEVNNQKN